MRRETQNTVNVQTELPPLDVQLIDPRKDKIDTPIDDRGLIDVTALVREVKATIDPSYEWPTRVGVHHFYWPESSYLGAQGEKPEYHPATFRDLPINKGLVPRVFENWLHKITNPAALPDEEVMYYYTEAWFVAKRLFESARNVVQWERKARRRVVHLMEDPSILPSDFNGEDIVGNEIILETLSKHFRGVDMQLERLHEIPQEFRLLEPHNFSVANASTLGKLVVPRSLRLVKAVAA